MPNIENSFNNNTNSPITVNLPKHIIPKALTTQTALANDIDFVGRKDELKKVDELLNQNATFLLLNGIGGIGKSTLASYYLNQKKDEFDYYGFVQVNEDIKLSLASAFSTSLDLKSEKIDDLFAEIMNKLQNLEGKKLLIIDDVKEMDNQLDEMNILMTLKNSGFQILFTSRETKEYIPQYFLDIMSVEDARELFLKHYATDEMDKVDKILEYLDYHTLFIEITAKTLRKRKKTLSLDKMIEKFMNGEFASIRKNKNESFNQFLNDLFADDKILQDEDTLLFIKRLSVLPSIEIPFENLYKFLVCEDKERLELILNELVDNGWLIESDGGYKFHQILKEFVFSLYIPKYEEIEPILKNCSMILADSGDIEVLVQAKEYLHFFESLNLFLTKQKSENKEIAEFFRYLANTYVRLGVYRNKIESFYQKSILILEKLLGEEDSDTAYIYNDIAFYYLLIGAYKKAELFFKKSILLRETLLGEEHPLTALSYNNIGQCYQEVGAYDKAELFLERAMLIRESIFGKKHIDTANSYNTLGLFYFSMKVYDKAETYFTKAMVIWKDLLGVNHIETSKSYHNIGGCYISLGIYDKAEVATKKSMVISEELLGEEHPETLKSYNSLAGIYYFISEYQKALILHKKTLSVRRKILGEKHLDTASSYWWVGVVLSKDGKLEEAYDYIKQSKVIYENILPFGHPTLENVNEWFIRLKKALDNGNNLL